MQPVSVHLDSSTVAVRNLDVVIQIVYKLSFSDFR